ncbi:hypothetical protein Moror_4627 [Moniliophthora roreri MCA 2997]|uniref:Uncharacterized protein n=2 Tax=Moniliophthora roreri TaxID=221103 RepID=A0A0W0FSS3_MONRR|nr:hypothetical protein Moror_4627 [Moniliophthora roreri MCA 2997]KAI3613720.1 hypothetical protein WG66_013568 [Moniliophthora roreri]KAI3613798.1 hypothetical protein WG66_013543 [Moniliophthora roreri]
MLAWGQSYTLLYLSLLILLLPPGPVSGRLVAKYIDDEYGDLETGEKPEFKGDRWIKGGVCEGCILGGALKPNPGFAFNGTWHDNTRHVEDPIRSIVFNFTGVSVEIFCILANRPPTQVTATYDLSFVLDGQPVGNFTHKPDSGEDFAYNQSVFSQRDLSSGTKHTMEVNLDSNSTDALLLFDYAKYEIDDGIPDASPTSSSPIISTPPTSTSSSSTSSDDASNERLSIILGVVLGTFTLSMIILLVWIWRRSRQPRNSLESGMPSVPVPAPPQSQYATQIQPIKGRPQQPPESVTQSSTVLSAYDDEGMISTSYILSQSERPNTVLPTYESLYRNGSASAHRIVVNR